MVPSYCFVLLLLPSFKHPFEFRINHSIGRTHRRVLVITSMLARSYMYARLRVHAVQCALPLRVEVDDTSPSLALMVRPLIRSYQVCGCSNFGLIILSDELTAGHSNISTRYTREKTSARFARLIFLIGLLQANAAHADPC